MDQMNHFSHEHPLILTEEEKVNDEVECWACGKGLPGPIYGCSGCNFYLHKSCADLPTGIKNFFHPCPLLFNRGGNYICKACFEDGSDFRYGCVRCDFNMHVKCTLQAPRRSEGKELIHRFTHWHPLTLVDQKKDLEVGCAICVKHCSGSDSYVYGCEECSFFLHNSCMINTPQQINHSFHPSCPLFLLETSSYKCASCYEDGSGLAFRCGDCIFDLDVKCALLPTVESEGADKIQHPAHQHPLAPRENKEFDSKVRCGACAEHILGPCFSCERCNFFIHRQCAVNLPKQIKHPFHTHPIALHPPSFDPFSSNPTKDWFVCGACNGFETRCLVTYSCGQCIGFDLHIHCAIKTLVTPFLVKYGDHPHLLSFFDQIVREGLLCRICRRSVYNCCFRCVPCQCIIHLYCHPSAPKTIKHKCHLHPLTLTTSPFQFEFTSPQYRDDSDDDEFYCDVCEEIRFRYESVYYCKECKFIAEIRCVLDELLPSFTISEEQSTTNGGAISKAEENKATIAKLNNEITVLEAKQKPLEVEIKKLQEMLYARSEELDTIQDTLRELKRDTYLYNYQLYHKMEDNKLPIKASTSEGLAAYVKGNKHLIVASTSEGLACPSVLSLP